MEGKEHVKKLIESAEREGLCISRENGINYITAENGDFIKFDDELKGSYRWKTDGQTITFAYEVTIDQRAQYIHEIINRRLG